MTGSFPSGAHFTGFALPAFMVAIGAIGCGVQDEELCAAAADHVSQCFGAAPAGAAPGCDATVAQRVLDTPCAELVTSGKGERFLCGIRWLSWLPWCARNSTQAPPLPLSPTSTAAPTSTEANAAAPSATLIFDGRILYEGSCGGLRANSVPSQGCQPGQVNWGCVGPCTICNDDDLWISDPDWNFDTCFHTYTVCRYREDGTDQCVSPVIKLDHSYPPQYYEVSPGVMKGLGLVEGVDFGYRGAGYTGGFGSFWGRVYKGDVGTPANHAAPAQAQVSAPSGTVCSSQHGARGTSCGAGKIWSSLCAARDYCNCGDGELACVVTGSCRPC